MKKNISYSWNLDDVDVICGSQKDMLDEAAWERIFDQLKAGYLAGELHYEDEDISVSGWWSIHIIE